MAKFFGPKYIPPFQEDLSKIPWYERDLMKKVLRTIKQLLWVILKIFQQRKKKRLFPLFLEIKGVICGFKEI